MTKDEIYSRMAEAYAEKAGFDPEDAADIGLRLHVLAGEMETVLREVDKVRAAAFPQTAGGEALDLHAGERGLERKPAVQAAGTLTFSRATALTYDVDIPAGTVCAASRAAVEFETVEAATLTAGMLSVTVKARAVQGGRAYNAAIGTVDTLVTPPAGIEAVTNETPFTGGTDAETDDALRRRLLQCYSVLPNGANGETYRRAALEVPGAVHANVVPRANGIGTVSVYLYGDGTVVSDAVLTAVQEKLAALREVNVDVSVLPAEPVPRRAAVYIQVRPGCTFAQAETACREAIENCFAAMEVGDPFVVAELTAAVIQTGTVKNCTWTVGTADYIAAAGEIVVPGEISVLEMT